MAGAGEACALERQYFAFRLGIEGFRTRAIRTGIIGHGVGILREVRHQITIARSGEADSRVGADLRAVLRPVDESVTLVGRGGQGYGFARFIFTRTGNRAALGGVGRGGDRVDSGGDASGFRRQSN